MFHEAFPNLYNVLASLLFLLLDMTGTLPGSTTATASIAYVTMCLMIFLILSDFLWYLSRVKLGMDAWKGEYALSRNAEAQLGDVLGGWLRIRDGGGMLSETAATVEVFWDYLRKGVYVMWYHRFYTTWTYNMVRTLAVYTIWVCAPIFPNASSECTPLHSTAPHSTPLHSTPVHPTPLHSTPLHSVSIANRCTCSDPCVAARSCLICGCLV